MRHRKKGRQLGRSSSHKKAMLRNLATSLILTERDDDCYDGLFQADGKTPVAPPKYKGRVVTTIHKAKEVRSLVEKCVTIARKAIQHDEAASEFETEAERNTSEWESWRKSDNWQKWVAARAPGVNARRRVFDILRDKEAVGILFEDIAKRFEDRDGGYTRVLRLAKPRLGDAGVRAILEFVGRNERTTASSEMPAFDSDETEVAESPAEETIAEETIAEETSAEETSAEETSAEETADDSTQEDESK
jgi:large subunit ribosomal protein L17